MIWEGLQRLEGDARQHGSKTYDLRGRARIMVGTGRRVSSPSPSPPFSSFFFLTN